MKDNWSQEEAELKETIKIAEETVQNLRCLLEKIETKEARSIVKNWIARFEKALGNYYRAKGKS